MPGKSAGLEIVNSDFYIFLEFRACSIDILPELPRAFAEVSSLLTFMSTLLKVVSYNFSSAACTELFMVNLELS